MSAIIIIPCFNEAERLDFDEFRRFINENPEIHFLFVDDGSSDGTGAVLQKLCANSTSCVLTMPKNSGKAEAVRSGILQAYESFPDVRCIGFWDADLSTPLSEINCFMRYVKSDTLMLTGCRHLRLGGNIKRTFIRHILGRVFATVVSWHLDLPVYDTQCGAKIFCREMIPAVFERKFISRWFFDVEILRRCLKIYGKEAVLKRVIEVPLHEWADIGGSKIRVMRCMVDFVKLLCSREQVE